MKVFFGCHQLLCLFIFFQCLLPAAMAQSYNPEKVNKKASDIYQRAYEAAQNQQYDIALQRIYEAIAVEPTFVDAYLTRAGIYAEKKNYDSSVIDFEKAISIDSVYTSTYQLPYSISLSGTGQFQKALSAVTRFLTNDHLNERSIKAANYRKGVYEFAINYQQQHPFGSYHFTPKNLGANVNSVVAEYYPSLTIDGSRLIFTRRVDNLDEDFFESTWVNGEWSKAVPLGGKVNTNLNEGAQNISQDGEWIVFTGCNYPEGEGSCDLYISYKTRNGWTEAENLGRNINTEFWESSPALSPDKKDLYFSSSRLGGYGGADLWVSHRNDKGIWSLPENLGAAINSSGSEGCAFMYADNQTLFFNSNGHEGYGGTDLYFSKKQADGSWSKPVNLGYPVNTIDEEGSLVVSADGKTAYYASEKSDSKGALDLYSFELREDIRPPKTLWVKGQVTDAKTAAGLPSTVELIELSTRQLISKVQTDELGNFLTTLPVGKQYAFNVNRKNYLFFSEHYDLRDPNTDAVFTANIPLQPIAPGALIVLKNVFFDTKKADLKPESIVELDKVVQLMNDNPKLKIMISGHTDNVGKVQDNATLSTARAAAVVKQLLSSRQIARERLQSKGEGASRPVADNATEAGRALNRRTELSVISN